MLNASRLLWIVLLFGAFMAFGNDRAEADTVLALALVHHLAIGRNVPLDRIASLFARVAPNLVVEWVPKSDPMVRRLLATREDVFPDYTAEAFVAALGVHFDLLADEPIAASGRRLLRLRRRVSDA